MKTLFQTLGYGFGRTAAKARSVFDLVGGGEEESLRAEVHLGHEMAAATLERVPLAAENQLTRFVADIGRWLAGSLQEKRIPFAFRVTAEAEPNAFALPGGHVFVSAPMLAHCDGERDEIAFLLGHEMAHVVLRHALDRIIRDSVFSLVLQQTSARHAVSAWLGKVGQQALTRAYSRENELEADSFAVSLIRKAGGEGLAAQQLLEKLGRRLCRQGPTAPSEYFSSHPPLSDRLAHLRSASPL